LTWTRDSRSPIIEHQVIAAALDDLMTKALKGQRDGI
jgi:hypothetical protein